MTNHPLDQLDPHTPSSDSVNSTASTRKSDTFRESWGSSKSTSEEVKPEASNQRSTSSTAQEKALSEPLSALRVLKTIFAEDVYGPTIKTELPQPQKRIEITQKLVYCNVLLQQDTLSSPKVATGKDADSAGPLVLLERAFDKTELDWLDDEEGPNGSESPALAGHSDGGADCTKIAEIVVLGTVLEKEPYRKLLSTFIKEFDDTRILDVDILHGIVQLVQESSPDYLVVVDLVKILDHKVQDLDRVLERKVLTAFLSELKGSSDPYLLSQASYAFQALQYVLYDETALQSVWRHSTRAVEGLFKVTAVFKLDLPSVLEVLGSLQESIGGAISVAGTVHDLSGMGFLQWPDFVGLGRAYKLGGLSGIFTLRQADRVGQLRQHDSIVELCDRR
ncbi:hypothetical protein BGZ90_006604, partial [Linnemannia elongata]